MSGKTREIVLPSSGSFARIERVTFGDWFACVLAKPANIPLAFAARVVTVDGHAITPEQIMAMDLDDGIAIVAFANSLLESAFKTMKGVALKLARVAWHWLSA